MEDGDKSSVVIPGAEGEKTSLIVKDQGISGDGGALGAGAPDLFEKSQKDDDSDMEKKGAQDDHGASHNHAKTSNPAIKKMTTYSKENFET